MIPVPIGSTPLNTLQAGDVLGIYDFAAFVTEATSTPSGFSGKALVRLPFLQGALALAEFSGLKAWSAQGEGNPARGGCVYEVSTFQLINVSQTEVAEAKAKLLNALAKQTDSTAFAGTLAGALLAYDRMSPTATADSVCRYKTAILQATGQITDALTRLDSDHPVVTGILKDLKTIADSLQAGNIVDHITDKYEAILARLDSLKATDTNTNPSVLAIGNVQVNELTGQSARISWETTGDVAKTPSRYVIEYTDPNGATLPETITNPQVNLQRLLPGTQYKYRITAYDGDRVLATYGEDAFTTAKKVVPMPENLAYTAVGSDSVRITWDANREHQSYKLIYTDESGNPRILYPTTNSALLTDLVPNKYYDYEIVAYNNERLASDPASARVAAGEECKLNLSISNAGNSSLLTGNQHGISATGCNPVNNESTFFPPISWSNGTRGIVNATKNMITFADGETAMLFGGRVLIVDPIKTTKYTAICNLGSGVSAKTCTYTEEIKVSSSSCVGDFKIMASSNAIKDQTESISVLASSVVELTASRCDGKITWDQGLGDDSAIRISPTKDMIVRASCEKDGQLCYSNPVSIKTQPECPKLFVKSTLYNEDHFLFLRVRRNRYVDVIASGCNGKMSWRHEGKGKVSKQGNDFYNLAEIENDVTVYAKCDENVCPEAKITVPEPGEKCNEKYLIIENTLDSRGFLQPFTLLKSAGGSKFKISDRVKSYNSIFENQVKVPALSSNNLYTADFENGCKSSILIPNQFRISLIAENKPIEADRYDISGIQIKAGSYLTIKTTTGCPGKIIWTNDQDLTFSQNLELLNFPKPATSSKYYFPYPDVSTTYRAICLTDEGIVWPSENSKTLEVPSEKCITIKGPATADIRTVALFETTGCLGNVKWTRDGSLFATTKTISDLATKTVTYKADCDFPVCTATKTLTVKPCQMTVTGNKVPQNPGDEILMTAEGCATTVIWQDVTGTTLGIGQELKITPRQDIKIKVSCHLTDCAFNLEVEAPKILPPKVICEELVAKAQPATIHKGELNNLILTAEGCSGGKTVWNGPGLSTDTPGEGIKQQVTATGVKETAKYTVRCEKEIIGTTYDEIEVTARIRLDVSASPSSVEKGKTTTLTAEGCGGGTITWVGLNTSCASPCIVRDLVINEPKTFTAQCSLGGDDKKAKVSVKYPIPGLSGNNYTSVYDDNFKSFQAYVYPKDNKLNPPYDPGVILNFEAENCIGDTVSWELWDGTSFTPSIYRPTKTETFVASCKVNNTIVAQAYRTIDISLFNCDDFFVDFRKEGTDYFFTPTWCPSTNKNWPSKKGIVVDRRNGQPTPLNSSEIDQITKRPINATYESIEFQCTPDVAYPDKVCYFSYQILGDGTPWFHGRKQYSTATSIGGAQSGRIAAPADSTYANARVTACSASYPTDALMASYFATLVCTAIDQYTGEDKALSETEAQAFLDKLIPAIMADPKLKTYPIDFSAITAQALADALKSGGCPAAGDLLGSAFGGQESADVYTNVVRNTFPGILDKMDTKNVCAEGNSLLADYQITASGGANTVSAQFNASSRLLQFTLKGFTHTNGKNLFEIITTPPGIEERWKGAYTAIFASSNPDEFLGFYKVGYKGDCDPAYVLKENMPNNESKCKILCKDGFLPVEFYSGQNMFYDDFMAGSGTYYNSANSQPLLKEIEELVKSMMDQGIYDEFLKAEAAKIAAKNPDGKISDGNLQALLNMLKDYEQAQKTVYGTANAGTFGKMLTFFKIIIEECWQGASDNAACQVGEGIVPRCWWDRETPNTSAVIPLPFAAGIVDGAYSLLHGAGQLGSAVLSMFELANCWVNLWDSDDCITQRTNTILTVAFISDLIDKEQKATQAAADFKTRLGNDLGVWSDQTFCLGDGPGPQRCCSYHQGKLVFDIASLFFGVGEVSAGLKGFKLGSFVEGKLATQMSGLLSKIKLPTGLIMKPIRKLGLAIGTAVMVASTDPAMVIKPFANGMEMLAARTTGKASAEAIQKASLLLEEGTAKTIGEAMGSLDNMSLKLTDEAGQEIFKDAGKIIFSQQSAVDDIIISHINQANVLVPFAVLSLAGGLTKLPEMYTPGCEMCKTRSKAICDLYLQVRTRAVGGGMSKTDAEAAINKICAAIGNEAALQNFARTLLNNQAEFIPSLAGMISFMNDVNKNFGKDGLDGNLARFENTDWFKAWGIVFKARCTGVINCNENTKADWSVLNVVREMRLNSTVTTAIGNDAGLVDVIKLNSRAGCNVCEASSAPYLNKMDQYLKDVMYFANAFATTRIDGVKDVLGAKGIKNVSRNQVEASAFILRVINEKQWSSSNIQSFEEKVESMNDAGETNTAFADIMVFGYSSYQYLYIVECKSWIANGRSFEDFVTGKSGAYKQFKTYLQSRRDLEGLEYWFDGRKASESYVKQKFQEMMYKNGELTAQGIDIFNTIWGNSLLKGRLFPRGNYPIEFSNDQYKETAKKDFETSISSTENIFFQFIKIK